MIAALSAATFGHAQSLEPVPAIPYQGPAEKAFGRNAVTAERPSSLGILLPPPPVFSLSALTEAERRRKIKPGSTAIGLTRDVPSEAMRRGACTTLPDGTSVWRLAIRSPGAISLRIHFQNFDVRDGRVWITADSDTSKETFGPYQDGGLFNDGDFWSATVDGDMAILTMERNASCSIPSSFAIKEVAHRWNQAQSSNLERSTSVAPGFCEAKFGCSPSDAVWQQVANSVVKVSLVLPTGEVKPDCTGSLIRTRSGQGQPFVLTAYHCFSGFDPDGLSRTFEFRWFNQLSSCVPQVETPGLRTLGARFVAGRDFSGGDYALLVLVQPPPTGAIAAGWDPNVPPTGTNLVSIHHPQGSFKHISEGVRDASDTIPLPITDSQDFVVGVMPVGTYLRSRWYRGTTEPASSGGPLFSSPTAGTIVGTLTAGPGCSALNPISTYGRFSTAYDQGLKTHLEDCTYSVAGNNVFSGSPGGTGTYPVTTPGVCKWTAKSSVDWIQIIGGDLSPLWPQSPGTERVATGSGTVIYNVWPNLGGVPRIGTLTVAGQTFYISQAPTIPQQLFSDVPPNHLFADYVNTLTAWGSRASGCTTGNFCPDVPTTRTMMAEFIVRVLFGENFLSSPIPYFPDVPGTHPSFRYIQKLRETSITLGCGDGTNYCPNDPVTREQMAAFIIRTIMYRNGRPTLGPFNFFPTPYFTDVPATDTFFSYIQKMKELGVTSGTTNTTYGPKELNTRGQIAVFLVRGGISP